MTRPIAALIACVKSKQKNIAIAQDLYISSLFTKSKDYAQKLGLPIFILSAKYGLISGTRLISPYNETLNNKSRDEILSWAKDVSENVEKNFSDQPLLVLAGERYLSFAPYVSNQLINPLKGLGLGRRLQWLKHHS